MPFGVKGKNDQVFASVGVKFLGNLELNLPK
jgi:hypothetical protein